MRTTLAAVATATAIATGLATITPAVAAEQPQPPAAAVTVAAPSMPMLNFGQSQIAVIPSIIATLIASVLATVIINDPEIGSTGAKAGDSFSSNDTTGNQSEQS